LSSDDQRSKIGIPNAPESTDAVLTSLISAWNIRRNSIWLRGAGAPVGCIALAAGTKRLAGENVTVNQSQLTKQQPNIKKFVQTIE
jgi:hypothetical protein